jgi:hypothetical protein
MLARVLIVGAVHMVTYWVGIDDDLSLRRHGCFIRICESLSGADVYSVSSENGSGSSRYVILICVLARVNDASCQKA